jgi:hypothetical protein
VGGELGSLPIRILLFAMTGQQDHQLPISDIKPEI